MNPLGEVGTSPFFRASCHSIFASRIKLDSDRAAKAFSFIRQAVNPLGKVGTSPFFAHLDIPPLQVE